MEKSSSSEAGAGASRGAGGPADGPLIVELVGLPGAGKTTVMRSMLHHLQELGYRCGTREALFSAWKKDRSIRRRVLVDSFIDRPRVVQAAARYLLEIRPWRLDRKKYLSVLLFTVDALRRLGEGDRDVILLDHSVLQAAFSAALFGRLPDDRRLRGFLQEMYGNASGSLGFVRFDVDPATSAARIARRSHGWSRFDAMGEEDARRLLALSNEQHGRLFDAALESTGAPALEVDAHEPVVEIARQAVSFIERYHTPMSRRSSPLSGPTARSPRSPARARRTSGADRSEAYHPPIGRERTGVAGSLRRADDSGGDSGRGRGVRGESRGPR
jgi:hypothetical protein